MKTLELADVSEEFHALINELTQSGEIVIVDHDLPVAKLVPIAVPIKTPLKAGCLKGFVLSPDFDAPLDDFLSAHF